MGVVSPCSAAQLVLRSALGSAHQKQPAALVVDCGGAGVVVTLHPPPFPKCTVIHACGSCVATEATAATDVAMNALSGTDNTLVAAADCCQWLSRRQTKRPSPSASCSSNSSTIGSPSAWRGSCRGRRRSSSQSV